jgi:hypothetical protein
MSKYIVFWKSKPGQQVTTVVDAHNQPVLRDDEYLKTNDITVLDDSDTVFMVLKQAHGDKYAVEPELARATLGWDV